MKPRSDTLHPRTLREPDNRDRTDTTATAVETTPLVPTARFDGEPMELLERTADGATWRNDATDRSVRVVLRWNGQLFTHASARIETTDDLVALDYAPDSDDSDETTYVFEPTDVDDFDPSSPSLEFVHRPDTGTPLKNGKAANRLIAIGDRYSTVIQDFIDQNRHPVTDDHGRQPLVTSTQRRLTEGSIRFEVYKLTQPCVVGEYPHAEDPDTCDYRRRRDAASKYPSSMSPHNIRRGSIRQHLRKGTPEEIVSDRMNVSGEILDQHYDQRSEREEMELRRDFLKDACLSE